MIHVKNGYPKIEKNESGITETTVYYSTDQSEIDSKYNSLAANGITRLAITHDNGIHELEAVTVRNTDTESSEEPDTSFGSFTASLSATMLSMPLEQHPKYRAKWNHFLFGKISDIPAWWDTATTVILGASSEKNYCWGESLNDRPKDWTIVKQPTMIGVQHYSIPSFVMSETARYRSFQEACHYVGGRMGKVVQPYTRISVEHGRNWLCEDAQVQWNGNCWVGTFSYTLSGPGGWNSELYS